MDQDANYIIQVETPEGHVTPTPEVISPAVIMTPQTILFASLSFAVLLVSIWIIVSRRRSSYKGNALLLVGSSDSGKTAILSTLVYDQTLPTHTSLQTNTSTITLPSTQKSLLVVDVPGHPRIRDQYKDFLLDAKAIAFIVDASTISRNGAAVAEHLHQILHALMSQPPSWPAPALAIVAHKCDLLKGSAAASREQLAINRVRSVFERELEKRRTSQAGGVGVESLGSEGDQESSELGGLECSGSGEFKFDQWEGGEISFLGTSVSLEKNSEKAGEVDGLSPLREWLEEIP
ncbi:P-loop containing nucleoside triphosphate hydrolase protein [Panus rudis PR-1116 ss-1]|nr:P-loop containing nucleoside triphosphate hydrolase protein [Panus rudis PR-1116 ss-1]